MKWYEKFKVGQEVRVVKKVISWQFDNYNGGLMGRGASWTYQMDKTIGNVFEVVKIDKDVGYRLGTNKLTLYKYDYWYPAESLQNLVLIGEQLLFDFMKE